MGCGVDHRVETELSVEVDPGVLVGVGVTVGTISVTATAGHLRLAHPHRQQQIRMM